MALSTIGPAPFTVPPSATNGTNEVLALVLGGGGARGAYQAGVLRGIGRQFPQLRIPILTGISAGAVNAAHLARHPGPLQPSADDLAELWLGLAPENVYDIDVLPLLRNVAGWGARLISGGRRHRREPMRGMVDTTPLRGFLKRALHSGADDTLPGIAQNIERGVLRAVALSAISFTTGQSVTWIEGRDVEPWERPQRSGERTRLTVPHVMASSALPVLFPAVRVGDEWFGDGGIRLTAPLSPALYLGATRILTISTRYQPTRTEAAQRAVRGYPPPAQVLGVLYSSIFLDAIDADIVRLERFNRLLRRLPPRKRDKMRIVDILVLRPSRDLGKLAGELEARLPAVIRYLTRGWGTRQTASPDVLSLLLFQTEYARRLIELGEADAAAQSARIEAFLTTVKSAA
jgi:NTE family protein